jgi:hypothetical protein
MDDQILDHFVERRFKTKTGYCYVTPDKIILTGEGVRRNLDHWQSHFIIIRLLLSYVCMDLIFSISRLFERKYFRCCYLRTDRNVYTVWYGLNSKLFHDAGY